MSSSENQPTDHKTAHGAERGEGLPVSPTLGSMLSAEAMPHRSSMIRHRVLILCVLSLFVGAFGAFISQALMYGINLLTALCFNGSIAGVTWPNRANPSMLSLYEFVKDGHLGAWIILMPVIGGFMAGIMARWGSRAIQGHGIPEAVEGILENESNIPARLAWLKPVSAAFAMGTGGPFGPEGPIIATGGAFGSLVGQVCKLTAEERKVLLAGGAAAGMAATFGTPMASLVLAIEVMLFEIRARSLIPVALATATAVAIRYVCLGAQPVFSLSFTFPEPSGLALVGYLIVGAVVGYGAVWITKGCYFAEDVFEYIPEKIHWMWWPVIGALVAGLIGWFDPRTLGVGYDNIDKLLNGELGGISFFNGAVGGIGPVWLAILAFGFFKFLSWAISLGSGTSGGTLAPLFMMGGSLGAATGYGLAAAFPGMGIDPRMAALVGMGAVFSGSARALLTSIIFAYEATKAPSAMLPLLVGCTSAYLVSAFTMRTTIMSEKLQRRGILVPNGQTADYLSRFSVGQICARQVVTLQGTDTLGAVRQWLRSGHDHARHQGFPVVNDEGQVLGVITQRFLFDLDYDEDTLVESMIERSPVTVYESHTLREAADHMVRNGVGRLIVVGKDLPHPMVGFITRGDILRATARRIQEQTDATRQIHLSRAIRGTGAFKAVDP